VRAPASAVAVTSAAKAPRRSHFGRLVRHHHDAPNPARASHRR
jgi:hypothetical protein